jgi:hypothetical protein
MDRVCRSVSGHSPTYVLSVIVGVKGARLRLPPGAGRARRGIELETRSAVEACVGSASVTTRARA